MGGPWEDYTTASEETPPWVDYAEATPQKSMTPAEYSAKLIADPEFRASRARFIEQELKNKPTAVGKILRSAQKTSPILSYYDVAGKLTDEASGTELPEVPYERKSKGLGVLANVKEAMGNVPASAARLAQGTMEMPGNIAEAVREQGVAGGLGSTASGMVEGIGTTLGFKGAEAAANKWVGAPVESLADVGMVYGAGKGAYKGAIAPLVKKAGISAFEKSSGVGTMPGEAASTAFESAKQKIYDTVAEASPASVKKAFDANWLRLAKPKNKNYAQDIPGYTAKGEAIIDEMIQQENQGRIAPAEYSVPSQLEAVNSTLDNIGSQELRPMLDAMEQAGYRENPSPVISALENTAKTLERRYPAAAAKIRGVAERYRTAGEMTPSQIQNDISVLGKTLKKDYRNLTTEQTHEALSEMAEAEALKGMLDNIIDRIPEDMPSVREMKQRYHAGKIYQENLMTAADKEMAKANNPSWNGLRKLALIEGAGGAATFNPKIMLWGLSTEMLNQLNTRANKPSAQIARMYRSRKALGPSTRSVVTELPEITPEATRFDPMVGTQIPVQQSGSPVSRPPIGPAGKQYANPDLTTFEPNMEPQVYPQNLTTPDISTGMQIPARMQGAGGPTEVGGGTPAPLPPDYVGKTSVETNSAPKQRGGKEKTEKSPVSEVKQVPSMGSLSSQLKQAVKDAGGGKNGTAAVAAMVGVSVPMLVDFIMGDNEKRKEILGRSKALGGLMMGTFAGVKAKNAPLEMLKKAQAMEAAGIADKQIWSETGWTKGFADKQWRFEIPDNEAKLKLDYLDTGRIRRGGGGEPYIMDEYLQHPKLYSAYGDLKDISLYPNKDRGVGASYNSADDSIQLKFGEQFESTPARVPRTGSPSLEEIGYSGSPKPTTLHELQHAVQEREGFARGGSPDEFNRSEMYNKIRELYRLGYTEEQILKMTEHLTPLEQYRRLAGEVEARLTANRMNLTAAERRAQYPVERFDVPVEKQIVRRK